jgi:hypothetical protein
MIRLLLAASFISAAFAQCPDKFVDAGELSVSAPEASYREATVTKELLLPKGIRIDRSYLQRSIRAASDGAGTNMRAAQIPAGIHLIPTGVGSGKWALDNPKLEATVDPAQLKLSIELWVNRGQSSVRNSGVRVRVCVKAQ